MLELETWNLARGTNTMKPSELAERTITFSVSLVKLVEKMPRTRAGDAVAKPLVKSGLNIGARYRHVMHALNPYDFNKKIEECLNLSDETVHWLTIVLESGLSPVEKVTPVRDEARRLRRIFYKSRKAAQNRAKDNQARHRPSQGEDDIPF